MAFDTSGAYEFFVFGGVNGVVVTTSAPTPDDRGGFITASTVRGLEPVSIAANGEPNGRTLSLSGLVKGREGRQHRNELWYSLASALPEGTPEPVIHYRDGEYRHIMAKLGSTPPINDIVNARRSNYTLQVFAKDSRILSGTGKGPDKFFEGAVGESSATLVMFNAGDGVTPPIELRFKDCINPIVSTDGSPTADLSVDIAVPLGDELIVNLETHRARLVSGLDVSHLIRGEFPKLDRKSNTFRFWAPQFGADVQASVHWNDSWKQI